MGSPVAGLQDNLYTLLCSETRVDGCRIAGTVREVRKIEQWRSIQHDLFPNRTLSQTWCAPIHRWNQWKIMLDTWSIGWVVCFPHFCRSFTSRFLAGWIITFRALTVMSKNRTFTAIQCFRVVIYGYLRSSFSSFKKAQVGNALPSEFFSCFVLVFHEVASATWVLCTCFSAVSFSQGCTIGLKKLLHILFCYLALHGFHFGEAFCATHNNVVPHHSSSPAASSFRSCILLQLSWEDSGETQPERNVFSALSF